MAVPKTTLWRAPDHTRIKHEILRRYLDAWYPILGSRWEQIVYLDGFAGPGEYTGGEPGSPVIALRTFMDHPRAPSSEVVAILVEEREDRFNHLVKVVEGLELPSRIVPYTLRGRFEEHAARLLEEPATYGLGHSPTFAFIDPFGFSGLPLEILKKIVHPSGSELFIAFMLQGILPRVFHVDPAIQRHLDELFGTTRWRDARTIEQPEARRRFLQDLYVQQLHEEVGIKFVRTFEMRDDRNVPVYELVFATNHELGLEKMKEAMWDADPGGNFTFSDATDPNQTVFFTHEPDFNQLRRVLLNKFGGQETSIEEVLQFVELETPFLSKRHVKRGTLRPMEEEDLIEVTGSRKRRYTYPAGTRLRFSQVQN